MVHNNHLLKHAFIVLFIKGHYDVIVI